MHLIVMHLFIMHLFIMHLIVVQLLLNYEVGSMSAYIFGFALALALALALAPFDMPTSVLIVSDSSLSVVKKRYAR